MGGLGSGGWWWVVVVGSGGEEGGVREFMAWFLFLHSLSICALNVSTYCQVPFSIATSHFY